jgi:hypothetical protein
MKLVTAMSTAALVLVPAVGLAQDDPQMMQETRRIKPA